ncbi:MAG: hypothetical protein M1831_006782 [Alyxoria varia]|nr:MAG: hypothetical protein M1831_006782 [Alyxoria varia]
MPPAPRSPILSAAHLASLRDNPRIPRGCWYFIASVTLSALNRPEEIKGVLAFALDSLDRTFHHRLHCRERGDARSPRAPSSTASYAVGARARASGSPRRSELDGLDALHRRRLGIARRTREALLKSSAVVGLPKTINALLALKAGTPEGLLDGQDVRGGGALSPGSGSGVASPDASPRVVSGIATNGGGAERTGDPRGPRVSSPLASGSDHDAEAEHVEQTPSRTDGHMMDVLQQGDALFNTVYGKVAERVMSQMKRSGTPDLATVARVTYGFLLSGAGLGEANRPVLGAGNASTPSPIDGGEATDGADGEIEVAVSAEDDDVAPSEERSQPAPAAETSFVLIAALIPQDVNPQLKGHLKGAVNCGASMEQVRGVRDAVVGICEAGGMEWSESVVSL